jgi:hypothetical protein
MSEQKFKEEGRLSTTLTVFEDRVIIERGLMGRLHTGGPHEKTLFFDNLTGVEYSKPGLLSGYLCFVGPGLQVSSGRTGTQKNENAVVFAFNGARWKGIADYINSAIGQNSKGDTVIQSQSAADELLKFKNLLDQGIINQEEFDQKKIQLLS